MGARGIAGSARDVVRLAAVLMLSACAMAAARPAAAVEVTAGWALTNVGLHDDGSGLVIGVGSRSVLKPATVDLVYALEYVQKRGSQPTWFSDPVDGFMVGDAEVTLHVAQPVALLELTAVPTPWPRPYAGLSVAIKLSEQWSAFPGQPSQEWGYEDLDFVTHLGVGSRLGPVRLDVRFSYGLTDQLIADPDRAPALKAEDPLPGVDDPVPGARLSLWQVAAVVAF